MHEAAGVSKAEGMMCPQCRGPIVRTFLEQTAAGQRSSRTGHLCEYQAVVRVGYRCWSAACGWKSWASWSFDPTREPIENILALDVDLF
jgi:hypothetical protein